MADNLHNNYLWCIFNTKLVLSAEASCKCKNLVNQQGYGNCKLKSYASQSFREFCYVNQPSNCSDLISSKSIVGEQFSSEACNLKGKLYMNIIVIELRITFPRPFELHWIIFFFHFSETQCSSLELVKGDHFSNAFFNEQNLDLQLIPFGRYMLIGKDSYGNNIYQKYLYNEFSRYIYADEYSTHWMVCYIF